MKYKSRRHIVHTRETVRAITRLNEGPWRWSLGIQAGIATGVSMVLLIFIGYPSMGTIASLGALATLYGSNRNISERLRLLLLVGAGMAIAAALGILCAKYEWLSFVCLLMITAVSAIITYGTGIGSPGPMMFVLAAAVSSQLAASANPIMNYAGGYAIPMLIGLGALMAWMVVAILSLFPFIRNKDDGQVIPSLTSRIHLKKEDIMVIMRVVTGVAAAMLLSKPLGIHRIYWVIVAVTAILQAGFVRHLTTVRAIQRVLGTILGVIVFEAFHLLEMVGAWLVIVIVLLQFATQVVVARNYVLGLIFITPMALLIATMNQASSGHIITARERVIDTLLGAGLAIIVFWIEELISRQTALHN